QNLVGNALKFHRKDTPPRVRVWSRSVVDPPRERFAGPGWIEIVVEDDGIGFEPKYAARIFQAFERLHSRAAYEGTGIGLALCRKIVERHGGTMSATST